MSEDIREHLEEHAQELHEKVEEVNANVKKTVEKVKEVKLNDQQIARRQKMDALREQGIDPFGHAFERTHRSSDIRKEFGEKTAEELEALDSEVKIAGRIMSKRRMG